jgi:hypothetical protein
MILSGHQPVYLPSIHLFNKIALSDKFMFVGHCQFVRRSWHHHNYILQTSGEPLALTVPVHGEYGTSIDDMKIENTNWRRKHLTSIHHAYGKRPFFDLYYPTLKEIIESPFTRLGFLNRALIRRMCVWFDIQTPMVDSYKFRRSSIILGDFSRPYINGHKTDMLVQMCKAVGAHHYLSSAGEKAYVEKALLAANGIAHDYQCCGHPVYYQGQKVFVPNMSALDTLFNLGGPTAGRLIKSCGGFEV